jgi:hypothetical protein
MASPRGNPVGDDKHLYDEMSEVSAADLSELALRLRTVSENADLDDETAKLIRQMANFLIHLNQTDEDFAKTVRALDASGVRLRQLANFARLPAPTPTR